MTTATHILLGGRLYHITGRDSLGLVTAHFLDRRGSWRKVHYGHRLAQLTVILDGTLPPNVPDSTSHGAVLARLRGQVDRLGGRVVSPGKEISP